MKVLTYRQAGVEAVGVLTPDETSISPLPYPDMNTLIETCPLGELPTVVSGVSQRLALDSVQVLAPIPRPKQDVICLGMNYAKHIQESMQYEKDAFSRNTQTAVYFSKRVGRAVDPEGIICRHEGLVERLDYEVELAVILGKDAKQVPPERVQEYIFGYTILNDVSARVLQTKHKQWYFGKSLDGFTPLGPYISTADAIDYPPALSIQSYVNGELRQDDNTASLMTDISAIVSELSQGMTLQAGTILATGTPAGVGMGFDPPKFLQVGDEVLCRIEGIGDLKNTVG